jgi:hypothetical protein
VTSAGRPVRTTAFAAAWETRVWDVVITMKKTTSAGQTGAVEKIKTDRPPDTTAFMAEKVIYDIIPLNHTLNKGIQSFFRENAVRYRIRHRKCCRHIRGRFL